MSNRRIFVDMDGVLAVFHPEKSLEEIAIPGYFRNLEPQLPVVSAINRIVRRGLEVEVYILSSVLNDEAAEEKAQWLLQYMPDIDREHMLFVPYGVDKSAYVREATKEVSTDDILLDDFTFNLRSWHGVGVKLLNNINNTKRSWKGFVVNGNGDMDTIYASLIGINYAA